MKFHRVFILVSLLCIFKLNFSSKLTTKVAVKNSSENKLSLESELIAKMEIESKFGNNERSSSKTLANPLRLFKLRSEKRVNGRLRFMWSNNIDSSPNSPINVFNYKIIEFAEKRIDVYTDDQNSQSNKDNKDVTGSTQNYLFTMELDSIDLPCNGYFFICTYEEMIREYKSKFKGMDFSLPASIEKSMGEKKASDHCLLITIGPFKRIKNVGFICADTKEEAVFYQSLISEKIQDRSNNKYHGQLIMINEVILYIIPLLAFKRYFMYRRFSQWKFKCL